MENTLKVGLVQMRSSTNVEENLHTACSFIEEAAQKGCQYVLTPEMTNIFDANKEELSQRTHPEQKDFSLQQVSSLAARYGIFIHLGSFAFKGKNDRFVNRSILMSPEGKIIGRYDKIHMFDVTLSEKEFYRESALFQPGESLSIIDTPFGKVGMSICFDLRFPHLYHQLAAVGARIITVPSAFTETTGSAHWHVLLRARAIETGSFILAAAQAGKHEKGRKTYGHSLIVDPWGKVISDGKMKEGVITAVLDLNEVELARKKMPTIALSRPLKDNPKR